MLVHLLLLTFTLRIQSQEILKYTIDEEMPVSTLIADFSAELHLPTHALYTLTSLLPSNQNLFVLDSHLGQLRSADRLDREGLCRKSQCSCQSCEMIFQVAIDINGKHIEKLLEIQIRDRNDHSPSFDSSTSRGHLIHIKENVPLGYRIVLPRAYDPDEGPNTIQSYTITGTYADDFDVDFTTVDTPYLIVRSPLDRQRVSSYSFTYIASDHGQQPKPLSASMPLNIQIVSVNDSVPTFVQSLYSIDVREDASIGTALLTLTAMNENDQRISYELLTESPFAIDQFTGEIRVHQALDYEKETSYRLTVKASVEAIPAYALILIRIIDVNDNPVLIRMEAKGNATLKQNDKDHQSIAIEENTPIATQLAQIILTDADSYANGNPYLQLRTTESPLPLVYKLIYQHPFQNVKFYSLIINQNLDRELKSVYKHLQLIAHDSGTPTLHTQIFLTLNITDVNDCVPTLKNKSTFYSIDENNAIGFVLEKFSATDCDAGFNGEMEYRLLNATDLAIIDSKTGEMKLNQSIDFETLNQHRQKNVTSIDLEFLLEVRDHGHPSLASQTKVILRINDINDHSPEFHPSQSYNWTVSKSSLRPDAVLGRIVATDQDSGMFGLIDYSIRSLNPCFTLDITSLGYVYLSSDSFTLSCPYTTYDFEIIASDRGVPQARSTRQWLTIHINHNETWNTSLPKLLPLDTQRTIVDANTMGNVAFILDLSTFKNQTYQPTIALNNTHLASTWNVHRDGEVRLVAHPFSSSYILSLNIIDEFTGESEDIQLQIKLCNSSIANSCEHGRLLENRMMLIYAISFALIITVILIVLFSLVICLCCRKNSGKSSGLSSIHRHSFLHYMEEYNSDKTETTSDRLKSSSNSTIRDDDHDSACIMARHPSSSTSSSTALPTQIDSWYPSHPATIPIPVYPYSSTYQYDLKLAEFLRHNQYPPCVHLTEPSSIPQSTSTDYGFSSLELSVTSSASTLPHQHQQVDIDVERPLTLHSFVSSRECVV